jgi:hypothetical protein
MALYLLHLEPPYRHAKHYLGFCEGDIAGRIRRHCEGRGSPLIKAAKNAGSRVVLVRVWPEGTRDEERSLKITSHVRLCPRCNPRAMRCGTLTTCGST